MAPNDESRISLSCEGPSSDCEYGQTPLIISVATSQGIDSKNRTLEDEACILRHDAHPAVLHLKTP